MTIFFASNQMDDFTTNNIQNVYESSLAATFDTNIVNNSIFVIGASNFIRSPDVAAASNLWLHFEKSRSAANTGDTYITFLDSTNTPVCRARSTSGSTMLYEFWNGSAWVSNTVGVLHPSNLFKFDINIRIQNTPTAQSVIDVYVDGSPFYSTTVNFAINSITAFRLTGFSGSGEGRYSQIILADEPTLNMRFYQRPPTAAGATQGFSGTFADVDEQVLNVADFISTSNTDTTSTFVATARPFTGFAIRAVVVSANARRGVNGPQSMQLVVRQGGIDYFGPTIPLGLGFVKYNRLMELNPATSLPWTDAEAASAALEFGVRSIA